MNIETEFITAVVLVARTIEPLGHRQTGLDTASVPFDYR